MYAEEPVVFATPLPEELQSEYKDPSIRIPIDKMDTEVVYTINPREVKYDPRTIAEAAAIFTELVSRDVRSLVFTRTRRLAELVANYARQRLSESSPAHVRRIKAYRAGYLPKERRQIERELSTAASPGWWPPPRWSWAWTSATWR
jgi:ATP-dependent helicase YprA (DUF1998 family)